MDYKVCNFDNDKAYGLRYIINLIILFLCLSFLLACSQSSWEGNVKEQSIEKNDKGAIIGVTLILQEFPDKKFFVPREIARGQLLLEMGDLVYGLKPEGRIKISGAMKGDNLIEVNSFSFIAKTDRSSK